MKELNRIHLVEDETEKLMKWARTVTESPENYFQAAREVAKKLGAHYREDGLTQVGFWVPRLAGEGAFTEKLIYLEVFTPRGEIDFQAPEQTASFRWERIELPQQGEFVWAVLSGMRPGRKDQAGSFYWLRYYDSILSKTLVIRDPLAYSLPYGIFAPAELYDMEKIQRERADLDYLRRSAALNRCQEHPENVFDPEQLKAQRAAVLNPAIPVDQNLHPDEDSEVAICRVGAMTNILQVHINTASPEGTLAGLTKIYQRLGEKILREEPLNDAEYNYLGYDAIQLLPIEPTIEYRLEDFNQDHEFFAIAGEEIEEIEVEEGAEVGVVVEEKIKVTLRKPNTQNWGYDVPILGSGATNPAVLGTLRPDELVDFIATLHNFPGGPIQVIYDLVYGHADNQALELLNRQYFKGPNMYGQDLNHQLPMVRAILLEMQRRKINTGADGIRVDGGQDFRFFNPLTGRVEQDDAYLLAMSDVVQEIQGCKRLLFTIFEDGRPWPEEGWEEKSTYRELIELRPESYQWGPLIFAHNTPSLKGFWQRKWERVCEVMYKGDRWITGCGNHDTVRRGNQIDHHQAEINWNLGKTLPEVLHNAYDNPATLLWVYGFCPGLPMDFLNAMMHSPWGFFRNTDERYGVKVAFEEAGFLDWQISPELYQHPQLFPQLKALGFGNLELLQRFMKAVADAMIKKDFHLEAVAKACRHCLGYDPEEDGEAAACDLELLSQFRHAEQPEFVTRLDVPKLKKFARAFMEDGHEACRVSYYLDQVDPEKSRFNLTLRNYRRQNPWLHHNLQDGDRFNRVHDNGHTLFYGLRTNPATAHSDEPDRVVMVTHMEGEPAIVTLGDWLQLDLQEWEVAIATPGVNVASTADSLRAFELRDGQGLILRNSRFKGES
ncbi:alpha-amylase [Synechocystis sp. FACHB-383]|uniref:glucosylglycerol hydrolase n=1 Tax=Synechocystis sp. FACHB-383 TaxID=2692864 RepID=UPI00168717F9|nr:glucosylglycerol hydrolase [Synechocystis sp. FACHB-383]MBD2652499.1 alpha-amylase [Synechocystis sp. FACHB-383]